MGVVSSFWMGAWRVAAGEELRAVAAEHGWEALVSPSAAVREALLRSIEPRLRVRFLAAAEVYTPFEAIVLADPRYPRLLRGIPDPPPVLFVEGCVEALSASPAIAVVGTRRATQRALGATAQLVHHLLPQRPCIVSGLARGIDRAAHEAALDAGLPTVAVLGHGLAFTSPRSNQPLRRRIVSRGGAVVSTWPDTFEASRFTFPIRNRWIAGLADVSCVMQAGVRSGALITAQHAVAMQRPVVAYAPTGPTDRYAGCVSLRGDGEVVATPSAMAAVVLGEAVEPLPVWVRALFAGDSFDDVAAAWGGGPRELARELVRLELEGVVVRQSGGRYAPGKELACHPW